MVRSLQDVAQRPPMALSGLRRSRGDGIYRPGQLLDQPQQYYRTSLQLSN